MDYISAVESACRTVKDEHGDLSEVHGGLELLLAGWRLQATSAGLEWDLLGTAVQTAAEGFHDRPPIAYPVVAGEDATEAWRQTVRLVQVIADRLDEVAGESEADSDRSWWAATAAARLRAVLPVRS